MKPLLLFLALLVVLPAVAAEQVYAWTDAAGVRHFSDSPPPASVTNVRKLNVRTGISTTSAPVPNDAEPADTGSTQAGKPLADNAQNRASACQQARANLELLQGKSPISMPTGAGGEPQVLDEDRRKQEIARAQTQVAFYCQ